MATEKRVNKKKVNTSSATVQNTSIEDVKVRIQSLKKQLQTLHLELAAGKLKSTSEISKKRKEVARLLTAESAKKYE